MKHLTLLFALACLPAGSWGQEAWPPALPDVARPQTSPAAIGATSLDPLTLQMGIALVAARNVGGFGAETARIQEWSQGKDGIALRRGTGGWRLISDSGGELPVSAEFGPALDHMNQFYRIASAAITAPAPTFEELEAALKSDAGVARVARMFNETIRDRLESNGKVVMPEIGGEFTAGGGALDFHENPDPLRPVLLEMARFRDKPDELRRLYREHPQEMLAIDSMHQLEHVLAALPGWERRNFPPKEKRDKDFKAIVDNVLETSAHSYTQDEDAGLASAMRDDWSGRYAGIWHVHPPDFNARGWETSTPPSDADMELAQKLGQDLTIVFYPDGFDAYDLSALGGAATIDPALIKTITYRSETWRARFQEIHDRLYPPR